MSDLDFGGLDRLDTRTDPPRVKFGPRPDDDIPFSWAERGLCYLHEKHNDTFSKMIRYVMNNDGEQS